jgi:uncharacterized repeat protein (TIGR01451 family)
LSAAAVSLVVAAGLADALPAHAAVPLTPDDTWGTDGRVLAIVRAGGTVFIGGEFSALVPDDGPGVARNHLGALDAATGQPTAFGPDVDGSVESLALSPDGGVLYAGGSFKQVGGATRKRVAAFDVATGALLSWKPTAWPNNVVRAVAATSTTVYVGGAFTTAGSALRTRLGAYDASTGALLPWAPTADKAVRALVSRPDRIYAGGFFINVNGVAGRSLTALDPTTGAVIPGVHHPGYPVLGLEASAPRLFAAGAGAGGKALAVSLSTGAKLWEKKGDGNVQAVTVQGSFAYFGGHFFQMDGTNVAQLVRFDPATGELDQSWLPAVNGYLGVHSLRGFGSRLYVGGDFDHVSGVKQLHFGQFTDGSAASTADVSVSIADAPDPVSVGSDLIYTVTAANAGPDPATGVAVVDQLPSSASFVAASPECTNDPGTETVSCLLGTIRVGGTAPATITVRPGAAGTLQNTAAVSAGQSDPVLANNTAAASTTVRSAPGVDLNLGVSAPNPVGTGSQFAYVLTVTNQGSDPATAVSLSDQIPADSSFVSSVPSQGTCTGPYGGSCNLGALAVGARATVTLTVTAPAAPMTLTNSASVSDPAFDPDQSDNAVTTYTTVRIASSDATPPAATGAQMFDDDHDGRIDRVAVTFSELLAACPAPCTFGWTLTDVPSEGQLLSVATSRNQALLTLAEGGDDPDTAVGLFKLALTGPNGIQDAAGNHAAFSALAPSDGANPIAVAFRQGHPSSGECAGLASTPKVAEPCDTLTSEWSEALAPGSVPTRTTVTIADPPGSGNDTISIPGFFAGPFDGGGDGYVAQDGATAAWAASKVILSGPTGSDYLTIKIWGACAGAGCSSLGEGAKITVTYVPSPSIKDVAGNPATGQFVKSQKISLF